MRGSLRELAFPQSGGFAREARQAEGLLFLSPRAFLSGSLPGGVGRGSGEARVVSDVEEISSFRVRKMRAI